MPLVLLSLALATDLDAAVEEVDRAAERVVAASTDATPLDPRYTPGLHLAVERACATGHAPSCLWALGTDDAERLCMQHGVDAFCPDRAPQPDPRTEPPPPAAVHLGALVPLGDGWVPVSNHVVSQELGTDGRWFP